MAIGVFAISAILLANTGQVSSIGNAKSEARVAFDRLMNAFTLCDRDDLARLTSPEWTYIGLDGRMYTREEYFKDTGEHCKPAGFGKSGLRFGSCDRRLDQAERPLVERSRSHLSNSNNPFTANPTSIVAA